MDRYFNEPIRRAFAEGRIIVDEKGNLTKNEFYGDTAGLGKMLNAIKDGKESELLAQATIIDELNKQNSQKLKLKTKYRKGLLEYQMVLTLIV